MKMISGHIVECAGPVATFEEINYWLLRDYVLVAMGKSKAHNALLCFEIDVTPDDDDELELESALEPDDDDDEYNYFSPADLRIANLESFLDELGLDPDYNYSVGEMRELENAIATVIGGVAITA